jgi:hypothetical protein
MQHTVCTAFALALLLSAPVTAQTLVLEADVGVVELAYCDYTHVILSCTEKHIENEAGVSTGGILLLDGERYIVDWMGPGYYLESGMVIEPLGDAAKGLRGQRWLEVYPQQNRVHTSRAWEDVDGNRALSASDTLALDGAPALRVKDVRLQLRVRPAPPKP